MRTTRPVLTSAIVIGVLAAALPSAAPRLADVEPLMARFLADSNVVGVSVGVERGRDVIVRGGWGLADRGTGRTATAQTVYRLGSSSKQFTAALVMKLVERGMVGLDDPVDRHLPQMPRKWLGITVRQLLNHTSGVPNTSDAGSSSWAKKLSPAGLLALVSGRGLQFPAGSKFAYSNSNYVMLGEIAERHYGKPLPQIFADELFGPLNLTSTRYCEDEYGANGQAMPYIRNGDRVEDAPYWSVTHGFGSGCICSTVADIAEWNRALHGGKVVSASSYAQMTTPEGAAAAAGLGSAGFGFGLMAGSVAGRPALLHGGTVPGFIAMPAWLPAEQLSIVILMNTRRTPHTPFLLRDLARLALGDPVTIVPVQTGPPPDAAALRPLAGTYIINVPGKAREIRFWVDGKTLMSQAAREDRIPLRPAGPHAFGAAYDWSVRFTFNVANGKATGLTFEQGGSTFTGQRKR
jgi:CubicO group peptidase (beta-lactamase class C family)